MTATLDTVAHYAPPDGCRPFLRTIAERPDDMGPRLVFADWLEEQGDPWGEFIRLEVELAGAPLQPHNKDMTYFRWKQLNDRHGELLARHGPARRGAAWARTVLGEVWPECDFTHHVVYNKNLHATFHWHAGLPADFTLSLDAWMGDECNRCIGIARPPGNPKCPRCFGTGRVNAIGPKLLAAAPVRAEGLRFAGKEPHQINVDFWWQTTSEIQPACVIDRELFQLLDGHHLSHGGGKAYGSLAAALDALARAAIAWATQQHKGAASR